MSNKQEEQQMKESVQGKTQDYLKQGYKVDNLSNGSIGIYLCNDEDTQELEYKTQKASNAQQEPTDMTDKLTVYKAELLELQQELVREDTNLRRAIRLDSLYTWTTGNSIVAKVHHSTIDMLKVKIELLEAKIKLLTTTAIEKSLGSQLAQQQLSDARVSLLQAYTSGVGTDVAEEALVTAREQYNAIHGV